MRIDTLFRGSFLTLDPAHPRARRVAVLHGRVVALDDDTEGLSARRTVDLGDATAVPGFDDAHNHLVAFGRTLAEVDLRAPAVTTLDGLYAAVAARGADAPAGSWVVGSGYDQNKLGGHPTRDGLDRAAPGHRVWLKHTSGHMCVVSSAVLEAMGVADGGGAAVPDGGALGRDGEGRLNGLVEERAQDLVADLVRPYPVAEVAAALTAGARRLVAEGVTSCTEAGVGGGWIGSTPVELAAYVRARREGALPLRVTLMPAVDALHELGAADADDVRFGLDLGLGTGFGDHHLRLGPVKIFADGSLIGRTAAMTEDYPGEPGNRGYLQAPAADLHARILAAHRAGWQVATHAIGDAALDVVLDAYAEAQRRWPRADTRHRIEHCALTRPDQLARVAALGVVPVPQGRFIGEIGDGMLAALSPARRPYCYRQRSFLAAGCVLPGSSDRPVVAGAPLLGIHDLVNQRTDSGQPFTPDEALTVQQALQAWTSGSAYAGFAEHDKGAVTVGRLADFAVLSEDPTVVSPSRLRGLAVVATVVGGEVVHGEDSVG